MMDGSSGTGTTAPALSLNKDLLSSATDEMLNLHRPNNSVNLKGTLTPDNLGNFGNTHYQYLRWAPLRSEEHTSELQSLMRISSAVFCLKTKKNNKTINKNN